MQVYSCFNTTRLRTMALVQIPAHISQPTCVFPATVLPICPATSGNGSDSQRISVCREALPSHYNFENCGVFDLLSFCHLPNYSIHICDMKTSTKWCGKTTDDFTFLQTIRKVVGSPKIQTGSRNPPWRLRTWWLSFRSRISQHAIRATFIWGAFTNFQNLTSFAIHCLPTI